MINKIYTERGLLYGPSVGVFFSVKISGSPNLEELKSAINFAVNRFEILRCRVLHDDEGQAYYVLRENRCNPSIEVRNYHLSNQDFVNEQEQIPFRFDEGELIRFVIENLDGDDLLLRIVNHHLGGDGRSILILIDEIMNNLEKIEKGTFSYKDASMIPLTVLSKSYLNSEIKMNDLLVYSMNEFNRKWEKEKVVFSYEDYLNMFYKYWSTNSTKVKSVELHKNELYEFKRLCRKHQVSVNSAIITAISKEIEETKKVSIVVEARPKDYKGMGNFAGSIVITIGYDKEQDFWENAKYIHNQIHSQISNRMNSMFSLVFRGLIDDNFQDAINFDLAGCFDSQVVKEYNELYGLKKSNVPFVISNLGVAKIKKNYGRFKVEKIDFVSPLIPGMDGNLGIITVNDTMVLNAEYREDAKCNLGTIVENVIHQFKLGQKELLSEKVSC